MVLSSLTKISIDEVSIESSISMLSLCINETSSVMFSDWSFLSLIWQSISSRETIIPLLFLEQDKRSFSPY